MEMHNAKDFAVSDTSRKWKRRANGAGFDPLLNFRAPIPLIKAVKAKAKGRNVAYSVVIREALSQYVGDDEGREHAA
jgi:predicted DNA binding CopG/RHH family protein